jgi:hypothetical protein
MTKNLLTTHQIDLLDAGADTKDILEGDSENDDEAFVLTDPRLTQLKKDQDEWLAKHGGRELFEKLSQY